MPAYKCFRCRENFSYEFHLVVNLCPWIRRSLTDCYACNQRFDIIDDLFYHPRQGNHKEIDYGTEEENDERTKKTTKIGFRFQLYGEGGRGLVAEDEQDVQDYDDIEEEDEKDMQDDGDIK